MVQMTKLLRDSWLHLNKIKHRQTHVPQKTTTDAPETDVYVSGEKLPVVSDFKYQGILLDSNLSFKKQIKKITQISKFNLANFPKHMKLVLTIEVTKLELKSMILPQLTYYLTSLAQACFSTLIPIQSSANRLSNLIGNPIAIESISS